MLLVTPIQDEEDAQTAVSMRLFSMRPQTYDNLMKDLNQFGGVMRDVGVNLPFDLMRVPIDDAGNNDRLATPLSLGKVLYLFVPRNDKLLSYWNTVDDCLSATSATKRAFWPERNCTWTSSAWR